jgi:hypothetical protein
MKLHEIETEIASLGSRMEEWAADHDGDITDFPLVSDMESLQIERNRKLLSLACLVKDIEAEAEALKNEAASLTERARVKANAASRIKGVIASYMEPGEKLADNRAALSWRTSKAVQVDCEPVALPALYRREKLIIEADKTQIKTALEKGEEIPSCSLVTKQNLQIK